MTLSRGTEIFNPDLSRFILGLMEAGHLTPADGFKERVMELLQELIPFDKALWGSGQAEGLKVHNTFVYRLPAEIMDNWEKIKHQDRLMAQLVKNPGRTLDVFEFYTRSERAALDVYKAHSRAFGIENAISTALNEPVTGLLEVISLYRSRPDRPFSDQERQLKQAVFPFLVQAWRLNQGLHFRRLAGAAPGGAAAICDHGGLVRHIERKFTELLLQDWPDWQGPQLPRPVHDWLSVPGGGDYRGRYLLLQKTAVEDLLLLQARPLGQLDRLTPREMEVAASFAAGLTHKEIGRELDLSPSTIRRHIESIYRKLEVSNNVELFRALNPEG